MLGLGPGAGRDDGGDVPDRQRAPPHAHRYSRPGNSIASALANEFTEAVGDLYTSALIELGLILFVITFIVLALAKLLLLQLAQGRRPQDMSCRLTVMNALYTASDLRQSLQPRDVAADDGVRPHVPALDPVHLVRKQGFHALTQRLVHADDAAAGQQGRIAQRDLGQPRHGHAGHADRHADRHLRRNLPRRISAAAAGSPLSTRFINDILLSAPSIVIGLFVYEIYVFQVGHFSAWAGSLALGADCDSGGRPHDREHAAAGAGQPARGRDRARDAAMEGHHDGDPALRARRRHHRHAARGRAHFGRDSAAAVHGAQQPVLDVRPQRADGQSAGGHLPVRDEPVQGLAAAGLGGGSADHARRAASQHPCAHVVPPGGSAK